MSKKVLEQEKNSKDFLALIEDSSRKRKSRIVLALDFPLKEDTRKLANDSKKIIRELGSYICAIKLNFHLIMPLSLAEIRSINSTALNSGLPSIADIKLNDIENTNLVATEYLWRAGFSAVIVNPFVGYKGGMDGVLKRAHELGKGVITLAYMSHPAADEGYGLELANHKTLHELFLERAIKWKSDGIIIGSTRPEKIRFAREKIGKRIKIFSPGSGAQGGDALKALRAGSDYLIIGRKIIESKEPKVTASSIYDLLLPWIESH
ncbi:MAG: orotidine 5'-phosphate decarboxylase / HUMPS family protein [Nitrososphaerales archaeon]